jgi:mono/diheme cytochrome c family protein
MMKKGLVLLFGTFMVTSFSFFQSDDLAGSVARGKAVYEGNCITCHMAEGEGLEGVFPPLAKTGRLTDKGNLVKIVLQGMRGPITVNGKQYDLEMIPVNLNDEEVRDVLNYMRNSWGNKAPAISLAEVKKFRDKK